MYRPREFGTLLERLRRQRGLSGYALSKDAGLSVNYVRLLERAVNRPSREALEAICEVLHVGGPARARLFRYAGIDPDPAATPEARRARRDAWPMLTYVLANHVLLPRLELTGLLARDGQQARKLADLLRAAATSPDVQDFCTRFPLGSRPPAGIRRLIERHFESLDPEALAPLVNEIRTDVEVRARPVSHTPSYYEPNLAAPALAPGRVLPADYREFFDYIYYYSFDRAFAVALFPVLYWEACSTWPFDKVLMPWARRDTAQQRRVYEAVRAGMSLDDLDALLLGSGELGAELADSVPARPSPDLLHELDRQSTSAWFLVVTEAPCYEGPIPPNDTVFDHLDRCEFLYRFPLLKLDQADAAERARSVNLPSWGVWVNHVRRFAKGLAADAAVLGERRFNRVLDTEPVRWQAPDSLMMEWIGDAFRTAVDAATSQGKWPAIAKIGRSLNIDDRVQQIADSFANRPPADT